MIKEIHYNTFAREWRCVWSEDDDKRSLTELQRVLEESVWDCCEILSVQQVKSTHAANSNLLIQSCFEAKQHSHTCNMQLHVSCTFPCASAWEQLSTLTGSGPSSAQKSTRSPVSAARRLWMQTRVQGHQRLAVSARSRGRIAQPVGHRAKSEWM